MKSPTINIFGKIITTMMWETIEYTSPKVMGILNVTPDSFYDGGAYTSERAIAHRLEEMLRQGADIIDVGAYSSRPGADDVSETEEFNRLKKVLQIIKNDFPNILVSIDTFRLSVIEKVLDFYGTVMVNDISGGNFDENMIPFSIQHNLPYVCMHMQGTPQTMQQNPHYQNVADEILDFFKTKIAAANAPKNNQFILDPGFGFGKTVRQNYELMSQLERFTQLGYPVLVGISRKSMIQKVLDCTAAEALNGTTVLNTIALLKGANIIRVHDVAEACEAVRIVSQL
ncbi:MAG: dihydropteroate synthase [Bacteroidales bacterium]|nr:dihydropteroate synthase [Bacteroidales bacterium]